MPSGGWWNIEELAEERRFVASNGAKALTPKARSREEFFYISAAWQLKWKQHVGRFENSKFHAVPPPGPITNWDLLDSAQHYDELKQGLVVGKDYELVTRAVWNFLQPKYGGGPAITVLGYSKYALCSAVIHVDQVCNFLKPEQDGDASAHWMMPSWSSGVGSMSTSVKGIMRSPQNFEPTFSASFSLSGLWRSESPQTPQQQQEALRHTEAKSEVPPIESWSTGDSEFTHPVAKRRSPLEEYAYVRHNDAPLEGQRWHIIEAGWLRRWKEHTLHSGEHPGSIRNWKLAGGDRTKGFIARPNLVLGKHYYGVGEAAWIYLQEAYGGGPCITSPEPNIYEADIWRNVEGDEESSGGSSLDLDNPPDVEPPPVQLPDDHSERPGGTSQTGGRSRSLPKPCSPMHMMPSNPARFISTSSMSTAASVSSTLKALVTAPVKCAKSLVKGNTFEV